MKLRGGHLLKLEAIFLEKLTNHQEILSQMTYISNQIYEADCRKTNSLIPYKGKYLQDTLYTLKYLSTAVELQEPKIFINYMQWFGSLAYYLRFNLSTLKRHFEVVKEVLEMLIEPTLLNPYIDTLAQGAIHFEQSFLETTKEKIEDDTFLRHLLDMNTDLAYQYVQKNMDQGMTIKNVYLDILQPSLHKVGELWYRRMISVAKEHYMTAAVQNIIGRLYSHLFSHKEPAKFSVTAVCAGDELHEIGMRMVADFFELSNWDSYFLGSNLPIQTIIDHLMENPTHLLAISATTSQNLLEVKELIQAIKQHETLKETKIILGGRVFNETPGLWKKLGADGHAIDAEQAVLLGKELVGQAYDR